jgi:methyl coenzyme M reductase gamma subunit
MAVKLGVRIFPHLIAELVRIGAKVTGEHGLAARLTENGIPENFKLLNSGMDRETGEFFLVFSEGGQKSPDPVQWQAPVYEKEKEASDGPTA